MEICQLRGGDLSAQVGDRVYARVYDEDEFYWMHNNNRSPENEKTVHLCLFGRGKCMTPKVRSLDGVARALLCVELKPCRLHEALLSRANCRICKRVLMSLMKEMVGIKAPKHLM